MLRQKSDDTGLQARRRKNLHRLGRNLQSRLATKFMDVQRLVPSLGFITVIANAKVNATIAADQANIATEPTAPIIENVRIHMPTDMQERIQNGDTVTIKVLSGDGTGWADVWRGVIGNPYSLDSRKRVRMNVSALGAGDWDGVIPPPAEGG